MEPSQKQGVKCLKEFVERERFSLFLLVGGTVCNLSSLLESLLMFVGSCD